MNRISGLCFAGMKWIFIGFVVGITWSLHFQSFGKARWLLLSHQKETTPVSLAHADQEDGCGLYGGTPQWEPYTESDKETLVEVQQCIARIAPHRAEHRQDREHIPKERLRCNADMTVQDAKHVLSHFQRIVFFGDSIMDQQYYTMLCMIDPHVPLEEIHRMTSSSSNRKEDREYTFTSSSLHNTTLQYLHFAYGSGQREPRLYQTSFPELVRTLTSSDAIVFGAGLHYKHYRMQKLYNVANFVAQQSRVSPAPIYFMETPQEEWPTSNGMYTPVCTRLPRFGPKCTCEPLTPARSQGQGRVSDIAQLDDPAQTGKIVTVSDNLNLISNIYPEFLQSAGIAEGSAATNDSCIPSCVPASWTCIPSCVPASWRNDMVRPLLTNSTTSSVHVVPLWRQLVSQGVLQMRAHGDCVHKAADTLIEINKQLLRHLKL